MAKKYFLILVILVFIIVAGAYWILFHSPKKAKVVNSYTECIAAGYPVLESYPQQCRSEDGQTFTEDIGNAVDKANLIHATSPRPNQVITSPLTITGEARGTWYFEASFPAKLLDSNGKILAELPVMAQGEWMTENFVPFKATLTFAAPTTATGSLVLQKDNPSGLAENVDQLIIPVKF